jgi:hypothetical protein
VSHGQVQEGSELVRLVAASDARVTLLFGLAGSTSGTFVHVGLKQSHKIRLDRSLFYLSQCHTCRVLVACRLEDVAWCVGLGSVRRHASDELRHATGRADVRYSLQLHGVFGRGHLLDSFSR